MLFGSKSLDQIQRDFAKQKDRRLKSCASNISCSKDRINKLKQDITNEENKIKMSESEIKSLSALVLGVKE